ncbi:hypothetical protein P6709_20145, partial [Jeotgalibacillus sp. ET6]|uniref:hypothetical protein n=1 Tax=Jeotgalibacillus sp. ET6 TaxID=3037260 RepID=UPI00241883F4
AKAKLSARSKTLTIMPGVPPQNSIEAYNKVGQSVQNVMICPTNPLVPTNDVKVYVNNKLQYEEKDSLNGKANSLDTLDRRG